jgi:hypothetical protein
LIKNGGLPGNVRFVWSLQNGTNWQPIINIWGNPAIPRVIAKRSVDRLKPKLLNGRTLGNLRPFPAKYNPRNDLFFRKAPECRSVHEFAATIHVFAACNSAECRSANFAFV